MIFKIEQEELKTIIGGATKSISGAIVNAITTMVKYVYSLGQSLGSSIRRIATRKVCSCR